MVATAAVGYGMLFWVLCVDLRLAFGCDIGDAPDPVHPGRTVGVMPSLLGLLLRIVLAAGGMMLAARLRQGLSEDRMTSDL